LNLPTIKIQYPTKHIIMVFPNISNKLLFRSVSSTRHRKLKVMQNKNEANAEQKWNVKLIKKEVNASLSYPYLTLDHRH